MKKLVIVFFACFVSLCSYSQEHIKFNGATFGQPLNEFVKGFPQGSSKSYDSYTLPNGYNFDLYNYEEYYIKLNSKTWECRIFSSKNTNTVFMTVSSIRINNNSLENNLMLLVKTLEGKYGGGINEKQENLGEIVYKYGYHREMLALYYYVKDRNNKKIGEIRISAAPADKDAKNGWIELSYKDYKSSDKATREYNSIMNNAL